VKKNFESTYLPIIYLDYIQLPNASECSDFNLNFKKFEGDAVDPHSGVKFGCGALFRPYSETYSFASDNTNYTSY